jgi:hypothetical protein
MATAKTTTTEIPELAQKVRKQLIETIQQGQQFSVDAAQTWVKAVSALPIPELPVVPGVPTAPSVEAATTYAFDVASDLLGAQRDFALQLTKVLAPATSV